jgi:hypothetical protein
VGECSIVASAFQYGCAPTLIPATMTLISPPFWVNVMIRRSARTPSPCSRCRCPSKWLRRRTTRTTRPVPTASRQDRAPRPRERIRLQPLCPALSSGHRTGRCASFPRGSGSSVATRLLLIAAPIPRVPPVTNATPTELSSSSFRGPGFADLINRRCRRHDDPLAVARPIEVILVGRNLCRLPMTKMVVSRHPRHWNCACP